MSAEINRGAVDHAIYHQYPDDQPTKSKQGRVSPAVSTREITQTSPPRATPPARLAAENGMLFFGPDQNILAEAVRTSESENETQTTNASASMTLQKVRQPADAPIEIE
jgi:hypothetical protein